MGQTEGMAVTNFPALLPPPDSDLALQATRDPYLFDFLGLAVKLLIAPRKSSATHHDAPFPDQKSPLGQMRSVVRPCDHPGPETAPAHTRPDAPSDAGASPPSRIRHQPVDAELAPANRPNAKDTAAGPPPPPPPGL